MTRSKDAAPATVGEPFEFAGTGASGVLIDSARVEARAVGYAQGWAQGLRDAAAGQAAEIEQARARREAALRSQSAEVGTAVQAVLAAADRLERTSVELTDQLSDTMLAAAVELAAALLGQELADPIVSARSVLTRVLGQVPDDQQVTVWLSPADHATLTGPDAPALLSLAGPAVAARLRFECDPALAAGDALAKSAHTTVDAKLSTALARLREYAG
ncbi:MAG TPA: FliH/SctL family protein [Jatrophihabitans sp.]|nr:FliH/SctL family protein [Jatrophihabitans sp.]